jgi:RNA polymerase sigma-70 factor (ECF subfamily)
VNKNLLIEQFEAKMLNHRDSAYNLARWITGHDQDAEDIVQEAYIRAFRGFEKYTDINSLGWLLTIVRNTSYNWMKSKHGYKHLIEFDEALHSSSEVSSPISERNKALQQDTIINSINNQSLLHNALKEMPTIFREVIVLHEIEGLSYREIADKAGIPVGTVMSRLSRGRKRLQKTLSGRMNRRTRN